MSITPDEDVEHPIDISFPMSRGQWSSQMVPHGNQPSLSINTICASTPAPVNQMKEETEKGNG